MKRLIATLLLLLPISTLAADYPARVVGVSDGDTLTVLKADKSQVRVRLQGIDAPESHQDYGSRAKQAASDLAFGKTVTIREMSIDRYERTVAEVILPDGKSLNCTLVANGMAWWYSAYAPNDQELARLQAEARQAELGLWGQPNPIPPWKWRKGEGVPVTEQVVGNRRSHAYHKPSCASVGRMNAENRVEFKTVVEAEKQGYHKAGDCK